MIFAPKRQVIQLISNVKKAQYVLEQTNIQQVSCTDEKKNHSADTFLFSLLLYTKRFLKSIDSYVQCL